MEEASNIENKQSTCHQPQQRPPRRPSVCTDNVLLPKKGLVQQTAEEGDQQIKPSAAKAKNILKNTADIILPIIKRRGSLPRKGTYLGPPDLVHAVNTGRRGSSVDSSRRPSLTTFIEEEMKPSEIMPKPIFYTPQPQRKSMSRSTTRGSSIEEGGGVYLGPSSLDLEDQQKVLQQPPTHPFKVLKRQETKMSIVCSMLGYLPQREFVEAGYDPTDLVRNRLDSDSIDSPRKSRPSLISAAIAPTFKPPVASVLVRQESSQSTGTNPPPRKSM